MIQIWTFPADPSTERVPSLAERVAYLRHPINLRLFNWRVPALVHNKEWLWDGVSPHQDHGWGSSGQTEACPVTISLLLQNQNTLKYKSLTD